MKRSRILSIIITIALLISNVPVQGAAANGAEMNYDSRQNEYGTKSNGTNDISKLLVDTVQKKSVERGSNYVTNLTVNETMADIEYVANQAVEMIVAIYSEDGREMLGSGKGIASPEEKEIQILLSVGALPAYYVVRVFMLDVATHKAVAEPYINNMNTKEMQTLLESSIDDYDQEKVVNFDTKNDTNFAVYNSNTIVIAEADTSCTVDDIGNGEYIFHNATEEIKSLSVGDVLSYEAADGTLIVLEVLTINVEGKDVTVKESTDIELSDVFDYVKVESDDENTTVGMDEKQLEDGIRYIDDNYYEGDDLTETGEFATVKQSKKWKKAVDIQKTYAHHKTFEVDKTCQSDIGSVHVNGKLSIGISSKIKIYATIHYQEVTILTDMVGTMSASFDGKGDIQIGLADIIIYTNIAGLYLEFTPSIPISIAASANITFTVAAAAGVKCDSENGLTNLSQKPTPKVESSAEGAVSVGLSLKLSLSFIDEDLLSASVDPRITITADMSKHKDCNCVCKFCMEGNINAVLSVKATVKLGIVIDKEWSKTFEKALGTRKFYYSFDYRDWGWDTCPHTEERPGIGSNLAAVGDEIYIVDDGVLKISYSTVTYDADGGLSWFLASYDVLIDKSEVDYMTFDIKLYDENKERIVDIGGIAGLNDSAIRASATCDFTNAKYYMIDNVEYFKFVDANHSIQVFPKKSENKQLHSEMVKGLIPGEEYVIAVVKEENATDLFASANLCYIMQATADSNGEINLECYLSTDAYSVCVYGEKSEKPNATPNITPSVTPGAGSIVPPGTGTVNVPGGSADAAPSPTVAPSESAAPTPGTESSDVPNPDVTLVPGINPSENPGTTIAPTSEPVAEPKITPSPSNVPTVSPGEKQPETTQTPSRTKEYPKKNTKLEDSKTGNVYKVTKVGKSVVLVKVSSKKTVSVKIPAMVNLKGITYQVTGMEKNVFNNCKCLKKVTIGNKVKSVGEKAFYNCKNLTRIVIGESVTKIEKKAFAGCKKVKTIVIKSEKLKNIGKSAFKQVRNSSKVSVQVPKNKYVAYRKLLQNRGIGKKVRIIKV